jgi:hypothetical protein
MPEMQGIEDALNRIGAAIEAVAKAMSGGGGRGASGGEGKSGRRSKPPLEECMRKTGHVAAIEMAETQKGAPYIRLKMQDGFTTNIFAEDADAFLPLLRDADEHNRKIVVYYTQKPGSKFHDFVAVQSANGEPAPSAPAVDDSDVPF